MVSADGVNQATEQGLTQGFFVAMRLDGGIAFDGEASAFVIVLIEPKIMRTGFCCYLFVFQRNVISKKSQFPLGGNMHHMQSSAKLLRHVDGLRQRTVASFARTHKRMDAGIGNDFALGHQVLATHGVGMDDAFILAMRSDKARRLPEQAYQYLVLVDQHIARTRTHEQLNATHTFRVGFHHFG